MDLQRVAQMNLTDLDARAAEAGQGFAGRLEFHREVAAVVIDAQVLVEPEVARAVGAQLLEEGDGLAGRFQETQRLGFEAKMEFPASAPRELFEMLHAAPEVRGGFIHLPLVADVRVG